MGFLDNIYDFFYGSGSRGSNLSVCSGYVVKVVFSSIIIDPV